MNSELSARIENFYEHKSADQQETLRLIRDYANSFPAEFIRIINSQELSGANNLSIFYEALAKDLNNWADFFLAELKRLLNFSAHQRFPQNSLACMDDLCVINPDNFKHRQEFVNILKDQLENENPVFRYYAIWMLPDFIKPSDFGAIQKMHELLRDPHWKMRYITYLNLKDIGILESTEKLSLADTIRAKLFSCEFPRHYSLDNLTTMDLKSIG